MKDRTQEQTPTTVSERAPHVGEIRARWAWVEAEVWTERMLATLETGIEGGKWFRLVGKENVFEAIDGYTRGRLRSILSKADGQTWTRLRQGPSALAKRLLPHNGLVLLKTSLPCGSPIFLKANHQLESRMREIRQSGSEGGAT